MRRVCIIIPTENPIISQFINDAGDISDYSRELHWRIVIVGSERGEVVWLFQHKNIIISQFHNDGEDMRE